MTYLREKTRAIRLIGAAVSLGARLPGPARAPAMLKASGLERRIANDSAAWHSIVEQIRSDGESVVSAIARLARAVAKETGDAVRESERFTVIGGDHSCAVGTWSGAARAHRSEGPLGLIWVDAHLDAHTPETTPSGYYHGMPVACLLGEGDAALTGIAGGPPAVAARNLCIVGARSFERQEPMLLRRHGVRVFPMDEVETRGLSAVMRDAAAIATAGTAGFGVSIDLDALDPGEAPAVGSPVPCGLDTDSLADALRPLARNPRLIGCEIAEFNPDLPGAAATAAAVETLLAALMGEPS